MRGSRRLTVPEPPMLHRQALLELEGRELRRPERFEPDAAAPAWHREWVFS